MHASLGDYLTDLVQNALEAGATRVAVRLAEHGKALELEVTDNGYGMSETELARALEPTGTDERKHPGRRFGLGLPFLKQMADATGGRLELTSRPGRGTRVRIELDRHHLDLPPADGLAGALAGLMGFGGAYELVIARSRDDRGYRVARSELVDALGELETAVSLSMATDYIASQEQALNAEREV